MLGSFKEWTEFSLLKVHLQLDLPLAECGLLNVCYGVMSCCRPSLLVNFKDVGVPRANIWTWVGLASPPRASAEPSSVAASFTFGVPWGVIRRSRADSR